MGSDTSRRGMDGYIWVEGSERNPLEAEHCLLVRQKKRWGREQLVLQNPGGHSNVFVNGERVGWADGTVVESGDLVKVGDYEFSVGE